MTTSTSKPKIIIRGQERGDITHKLMHLKINKGAGKIISKDDYYQAIKAYDEIKLFLDDDIKEMAQKSADLILYHYHTASASHQLYSESYIHWKGGKGIIDAYYLDGDEAHVFDLKTGGDYDRIQPDDKQFMYYAAGIIRTFENVTRVMISVIQGENIKSLTFEKDAIIAWEEAAYQKQKAEEIANTQNSLARKLRELIQEIALVPADKLDGETLLALKEAQSLVTKAFKDAEAEVKRTGIIPEGLKMAGTKQERLTNAPRTIEWLQSKGYTREEITNALSFKNKDFKELVSLEHLDQAQKDGIMERYISTPTLKPI